MVRRRYFRFERVEIDMFPMGALALTWLTMLLTEQHARLALGFSDHAIVLDRGRIVHTAPAADLLADPERLAILIGVAR